MSSTTTNLKNINFMSESKYNSLTEIHDDELYAVKINGLDGEQLINQNPNEDPVKVWTGTQEEYDALSEYDASTIYNITDGVGGDTIATTNGNNTFTGTNNFVTPSLDDNTTKVATTAWVNSVVNNKMSLTLLDFKWTDHILNNISWLRADTFSWQDGGVYEAAYDHLVDDYNGSDKTPSITIVGGSFINDGTYFRDSTHDSDGKYAWNKTGSIIFTNSETPSSGDNAYTSSTAPYKSDVISSYSSGGYTETVGSYTITYYLAQDGHKIILPDMETTATNIYNESGVAWYYILDTTNQRFKLPRENPAREVLGQTTPVVGNGNVIKYTVQGTDYNALVSSAQGATHLFPGLYNASGNPAANANVELAKTESGMIADLSETTGVYKGKKYLYFYVGQYSQSATEQTAGLNSELFNGKLDIDAGNATASTVNTLVNKANSETKGTIVGWAMPDYTSAVSFSSSITAPYDCMIECGITSAHNSGWVSIDGVSRQLGNGRDDSHDMWYTAYVPKGITIASSGCNVSRYYKLKGVNNA